MSITTTNEIENSHIKQRQMDEGQDSKETTTLDFGRQMTVSGMIKTMLEIIKVKNTNNMDEETKRQFPAIAREIILLAEQTQ
jgi:hypothetical protein